MTGFPQRVNKILFFTLSNIGDAILTVPVLDRLQERFPGARIDVMAGPRSAEVFAGDPRVERLFVYDKGVPFRRKAELAVRLRRERYDLVVDLRNSLIQLLAGARYRTSFFRTVPAGSRHKKDVHLARLRRLGIVEGEKGGDSRRPERGYLWITERDRQYAAGIFPAGTGKKAIVISPGARSRLKQWDAGGFVRLADALIEELSALVVLAGDADEEPLARQIAARMKNKPLVLAGKTSLGRLAALIERADLVVTNDSAPLHLGSMAGTPVLAMFGPTDPEEYGPLSRGSRVVRKKLDCAPCRRAECPRGGECMRRISPEEVLAAAREMLGGKAAG